VTTATPTNQKEQRTPARHATPARTRRRAARTYPQINGVVMVIIAGVVLSLIGMLYLIQTSQVAGLGYELSRLQDKYDALELENTRLGSEVAHREALDTVEQVASQELGMQPMGKHYFLDVQRPAQEQLQSPPAEMLPPESFWRRVERAILGIGRAMAPEQHATAAHAPLTTGPAR
jgi:cell division protein FtsL